MSISSFEVPGPYAQPLDSTERDDYVVSGAGNVTNIDFDPEFDSSEPVSKGNDKPKWSRVNL